MRNKILAIIALVIGVVVCQISFLPTWPAPVSDINLIVCLLVFLTIHWGYPTSLIIALASGMVLEVYAPYPFGTVIISLLLVTTSVYFLASRVFTNRSWTSMMLSGVAATLAWWIGVLGGTFLLGRQAVVPVVVSLASWEVLGVIFWQILLHGLLLTILFYTVYTFSRTARSGFHLIDNFR
jgi:cell shape-determining protein MreD